MAKRPKAEKTQKNKPSPFVLVSRLFDLRAPASNRVRVGSSGASYTGGREAGDFPLSYVYPGRSIYMTENMKNVYSYK